MQRADMDVDIASFTAGGEWTTYQKLILLLCASAIVLDGFETQAGGFAAPAIMRDWALTKDMLAPALAAGPIGMTIGAASAGVIGDRYGRKTALVISVLVFGLMSVVMAFATDLFQLGALRLVAGLGLGGAMPNAAALIAEFTTARRRSLAVAMSIVCVPVGGVLGGFISAAVLPSVGWRALFAIAGALSLLVLLLLVALLPESPQYLVRRGRDEAKLRKIARRCGIAAGDGVRYSDPAAAVERQSSFRDLFAGPLLRDTLSVWGAFFFCLLALYSFFNWLPSLLADAGFGLAAASVGLLSLNFGAVASGVGVGALIATRGSRAPLFTLAVGGSVGAVALICFPLSASTPLPLLVVAFVLQGACIGGLQIVYYSMAVNVFPAGIRTSGLGSAAGFGRLGAVASSVVGAAALARAGAGGFFGVVAVTMAAAAVCILLIRRHVPMATGLPGMAR